jgi:hypothetical protein
MRISWSPRPGDESSDTLWNLQALLIQYMAEAHGGRSLVVWNMHGHAVGCCSLWMYMKHVEKC